MPSACAQFQTKQTGINNDRSSSGICHPRRPCRRPARSDHRRAGDADLPDHVVRVQRRRSCRVIVRAAGVRQYLHTHRKSDQRGAGRARRVAGRRHRGGRGGFRPCGAGHRHAAIAAARRRIHRRAKTVWRFDQPVHPRLQELWLERGVGRLRRHLKFRARGDAAHQGDLRRIDRQPRRHRDRHRGGLGGGPQGRRAA